MVSWRCPRCERAFFGASRAEKDKYVKCIYCGYMVLNPYYNPPDEDLREKQIKALEKRVVELETRNRELEAQCAAMREALQEAISLLKGEKKFSEDLTIWGPGGYNIARIDAATARGEEALSNDAGRALLERMAKLEAVVEAAQKCMSGRIPWCEPCYRERICDQEPEEECTVYQLKKALAELEGDKVE